MTFDRDELAALLLQALEGRETAPQDEPGTITTPEFARAAGLSEERAKSTLRAAWEEGLVEPAKVKRVTIFGDVNRRPGWRFVERPE